MKKLIFLIAIICLIGCSPDHTYKYFDFKASSLEAESGVIKVGLLGEFVLVDPSKKMKITHKGSPYEFWVWFQTDNKEIKKVTISNIQLSYKNGAKIKSHKGGTLDLNWSEYKKTYSGGWHFSGLQLEHQPVQVKLKASIGTKEWATFTFDLETEYKEEQANDFWSMVMSV
ncbi:hypothetical protein [uncultured Desulfuromusa sp.]|uniref:hypothetical protein n=1 Tax=uncultured Desulfuromusa sp. TaxID=219183 RepID=UPI002AA76AEE|nr:hypothetical protein [uncultured Desulfuromusa sp.]